MSGGTLFIDGIAFWAPTLPGWEAARSAFRGESEPLATPAKRPAPEILAPAERRRAPDTVALALEVAAAAVRESGLDAATLPSVFTSANGFDCRHDQSNLHKQDAVRLSDLPG